MILLCGITIDEPLCLVRAALDQAGIEYALFDQQHFAEATLDYRLVGA